MNHGYEMVLYEYKPGDKPMYNYLFNTLNKSLDRNIETGLMTATGHLHGKSHYFYGHVQVRKLLVITRP